MDDDFDDFNLEEIVEYDSVRERIEMKLDQRELTELLEIETYLEKYDE